jgi:hypothetical protein
MRRAFLPLLALLLLATAGCNNSSTEPNRTLTYGGTLTKAADRVDGTLDMKGTGNARVTLTKLSQTAADGTPVVPPTLAIGMGIGPQSDPCIPTGSFLFQPESHISLGLDRGSYCLRFGPSATLAEGVSVTFELQIEVAD